MPLNAGAEPVHLDYDGFPHHLCYCTATQYIHLHIILQEFIFIACNHREVTTVPSQRMKTLGQQGCCMISEHESQISGSFGFCGTLHEISLCEVEQANSRRTLFFSQSKLRSVLWNGPLFGSSLNRPRTRMKGS